MDPGLWSPAGPAVPSVMEPRPGRAGAGVVCAEPAEAGDTRGRFTLRSSSGSGLMCSTTMSLLPSVAADCNGVMVAGRCGERGGTTLSVASGSRAACLMGCLGSCLTAGGTGWLFFMRLISIMLSTTSRTVSGAGAGAGAVTGTDTDTTAGGARCAGESFSSSAVSVAEESYSSRRRGGGAGSGGAGGGRGEGALAVSVSPDEVALGSEGLLPRVAACRSVGIAPSGITTT